LTPCGTIILEEQRVSQLVRKDPAFYGARKFHKRLPPVLLLTQMNPLHIHNTSWALPCLCLCSRQGCVSIGVISKLYTKQINALVRVEVSDSTGNTTHQARTYEKTAQ